MLIDPPTPTAVLGASGIGKSSILVSAIHAERVAEQFGPRRFFVRLDEVRNSAEMLSSIAFVLAVESSTDLRGAISAYLASEPACLVLDSFDTPWKHDPSETEHFLTDLVAAAPQLSLSVSILGEEFPDTIWWNTPVHLKPLGEAESRFVFLSIAGEGFATDPDLAGTLRDLGGVSLAIHLVGHRARAEHSLSEIAKQLKDERARLLNPGRADDTSVALAAAYEAAIQVPDMTTTAKELLRVLGVLPDGLSHADLAAVLGASPADADAAAGVLTGIGLAFDEADRILVHPDLRNYVSDHYRLSDSDNRRVVAHYLGLAKLGDAVATPQGGEAVARLASDRLNIARIIEHDLDRPDPRPAVDAACSLAEFYRCTGYGALDLLGLAAARALEVDDLARAALAYFRAGEIALQRGDHESARGSYSDAVALYRSLADVLGEANCISRLGDIALFHSDLQSAQRSYEQALPIYRVAGDALGEATCMKCLGDIASEREDLTSASKSYEDALPIYRRIGDYLGEANCIKGLAKISFRSRDHDLAKQRYDEALPLYQQVGDILGEANCIMGLGDIARRLRDHKAAWLRYEEAMPLFRRAGSVHGEANCIQSLGDIALRQRDRESARRNYRAALALYERVNDPYSIGITHWAQQSFERKSRAYTRGTASLGKYRPPGPDRRVFEVTGAHGRQARELASPASGW
jgi:tetratricopeptide (TPR) repeat protein